MKKIYVISLFLICIACNREAKDISEQQKTIVQESETINFTEAQVKYANIQLGRIEEREIRQGLKVNGAITLPADGIVSVTPMINGFITEINVLPGQHVREGTLLAKLQHQELITLQQKYLEAKSQITYLEKEFERQKKLVEENAGSAKNFEKTESEYRSLKAKYNALRQQLKLVGLHPDQITPDNITNTIQIYSPVGGYISESRVNIGKYISAEEVIFDILCNKQMHLKLEVFEKDILQIKEGQAVNFTIPSDPENVYIAKVDIAGRMVDNETKTIPVYCNFQDHYKELRHGMKVSAEIITHIASVRALPETAVIKKGSNYFVFQKLENNTFSRFEVETGTTDSGYIEILNYEEIKDKDIVIQGTNYLEAEFNKEE